MSEKRELPLTLALPLAPAPDADTVVRYLGRHPDFLLEHPELLETLTPPMRHSGGTVTDLGHFMACRLQEEVNRLSGCERALLASARNLQKQHAQVQIAALAMLDAQGFEHLIHIVTRDLPDQLQVDAISICIEAAGDDCPRPARASGVFVLEPGMVDGLIGEGGVFTGLSDRGQRDIFGPAAGLVRSLALIKLNVSSRTPCGLLALGARDAEHFQRGRNSDYLSYLGRHLERLLRTWLDLPA